jgi:hypothetical protein
MWTVMQVVASGFWYHVLEFSFLLPPLAPIDAGTVGLQLIKSQMVVVRT